MEGLLLPFLYIDTCIIFNKCIQTTWSLQCHFVTDRTCYQHVINVLSYIYMYAVSKLVDAQYHCLVVLLKCLYICMHII